MQKIFLLVLPPTWTSEALEKFHYFSNVYRISKPLAGTTLFLFSMASTYSLGKLLTCAILTNTKPAQKFQKSTIFRWLDKILKIFDFSMIGKATVIPTFPGAVRTPTLACIGKIISRKITTTHYEDHAINTQCKPTTEVIKILNKYQSLYSYRLGLSNCMSGESFGSGYFTLITPPPVLGF